MYKRQMNIIDELINSNTDHSMNVLIMACIFFNIGNEIFGNDYYNLLIEYISNNNQSVDELVLKCSISHSGYYRKIKTIYSILNKIDNFIKNAFNELKFNMKYFELLFNDKAF